MSSAPNQLTGSLATFPARPVFPPKPSEFDQIFEDAAADFASITGQNVRGLEVHGLDDVMGMFGKFNEPVSREDEEKRDRTKLIVKGVLTGLYVLNGVAMQAASGIFPQSNVCFNAVGWLLKIPSKVSELNDGIGELFTAIDGYLGRFKVLQDISHMDGQSVKDMVEGTKAIMRSFVRICALCYHKWAGKKREKAKLIFKAIFADENSRIKGELATFEKLLGRQADLTGAVTLKAVISTKKELFGIQEVTESINLVLSNVAEQVDDIGVTTRETEHKVEEIGVTTKTTEYKVDEIGITTRAAKEGVERLVSETADRELKSQTEKDRSELLRLMYPGTAQEGNKILDELDGNRKKVRDQTLGGSGKWLSDLPEYQNWRNNASVNHILVLSGGPGCGKTSLVSRVWDEFEKENENETSFLVAYHQFSKRQSDAKDNDKDLGAETVIQALKKMAFQLSEKSMPYRRELLSSCKSPDGHILREKSPAVEDVWKTLKLASSSVKSNYVFVLIFEDYHRLSSGAALGLAKLLNFRNNQPAATADSIDTTRFRVLLTTEEEVSKKGKPRMFQEQPNIVVNEHNHVDIELYIANELEDPIFEQLRKFMDSNGDSELKEAFSKHLPVAAAGSFNNVKLKMKRLEAAVKSDSDDESFSQIKKMLRDKSDVDRDTVARSAITKLNSTLNSNEKQQLNTVLQWLVHGSGTFNVPMLESILSMTGVKLVSRLQSFASKVKDEEKFGKILKTRKEYGREIVEVEEEVLTYLTEQYWNKAIGFKSRDAPRGQITMNITFDRAEPEDMKAFFFQLQQRITTDYGIFPLAQQVDTNDGIYVNPEDSYQVIVERALELLTDLPDENFAAMVRWATRNLPKHLDESALEENKKGRRIIFKNRKKILKSLISLLTDPQLTVKHWLPDIFTATNKWLDDDKALRVVEAWLHDESTVKDLKPKYHRRLVRLLDEDDKPGGFWKPLTLEVARNWLVQTQDFPDEQYVWIDGFIGMQERLSKTPTKTISKNEASQEDEHRGKEFPSAIKRFDTMLSLDDHPKPQLTRSQTNLDSLIQGSQQDEEKSSISTATIEPNDILDPPIEDIDLEEEFPRHELSSAAKIKRAAAWAATELDITEFDATWYERLGFTYYFAGDADQACECLKEGVAKYPHELKLHAWLSEVYGLQDKPKLAVIHLRTVINALESVKRQSDVAEKLGSYYGQLGINLSDAGDNGGALKAYFKALELTPRDYKLRVNYLKSLLDCGRRDEVLNFLSVAHETEGSERELKELPSILYSLSRSNPWTLLSDMITVVRRCQRLDLALAAVKSSIKYAQGVEEVEHEDIAMLLSFEANLLALNSSEDSGLHQAYERWTSASKLFRDSSEKGSYFHWQIECLRSSYLLREALRSNSAESAKLLEEIGQALQEDDRDATASVSYLARFYLEQGQKDKAKELFASTMKEAFTVLSNDDTSDDCMGYSMMADVFGKIGEDVNASTALSLIGPKEWTPSQSTRNVTLDHADETPENAEDLDAQTPDESRRTGHVREDCAGKCGKSWSFADDYIRCKVCPETVFCRDCHDRLCSGSPHIYWCHPEHDFIEVPAWPEVDWPLGTDKVRIGGWAKPDGEIVLITEWLDRVREDWGIDKPKHYDLQDKKMRSKPRIPDDSEVGGKHIPNEVVE